MRARAIFVAAGIFRPADFGRTEYALATRPASPGRDWLSERALLLRPQRPAYALSRYTADIRHTSSDHEPGGSFRDDRDDTAPVAVGDRRRAVRGLGAPGRRGHSEGHCRLRQADRRHHLARSA